MNIGKAYMEENNLDLHYYGARFYDSKVSRFLEFIDDKIAYLTFGDGRIIFDHSETKTKIRFQYSIKDHLGNHIVTFEDINEDGIIEDEGSDSPDAELEVIQRNMYYAFGMELEGLNNVSATPGLDYKYNSKELHEDFGLGWSNYGARFYDPAIGKWNTTDPLASKYPSISPYAYANNNPIYYVDPDGRENIPALIWAAKNMANKGIKSNYGNPYFGGNDNRWTYNIGSVPDRSVCYESCFMAYMNSGESSMSTLKSGFTNKYNAFKGRSTETGGMNWFKSGNGTDRSFVTDISKGELGDIVFMGEVGDMQGHAVLLASDITSGTTEFNGSTVETMSFSSLSTSSDTDSGSFGVRDFNFYKVDGKWLQDGTGHELRGFGQMHNVNATDAQRQEAKQLINDLQK